MIHLPSQAQDFYNILSINHTASPAEIKLAYHRTLLLFHPDKTNQRFSDSRHGSTTIPTPLTPTPDISLIKEAYMTLSTPHLRAQYDRNFLHPRHGPARSGNTGSGPRPAQVVSLEDFEMQHVRAGVSVEGEAEDEEAEGDAAIWSYACRCGGTYRISSDEMEQGSHLVGCTGCSEVIWVGYELAEDDADVE